MFLRNNNPLFTYLLMMLTLRVERAKRSDRGASAVEWVVIAAIVVGICVAVGAILLRVLRGKATEVGGEISGS